jgi:hypothetical protein
MKQLLIAFCLTVITNNLFAQQYIADKESGCKVWDISYSADQSITWKGGCKDGLASGYGTLIWYANGKQVAFYNGQMKTGNQNGYGKFAYTGGGEKNGNFVDGEILDLDSAYLKRLTKNPIKIKDSTQIYDSFVPDRSLFYYSLLPQNKIVGALVLMPSTWERPESVITNNKKLSQLAADNGLVVIVPSSNMHICLDQPVTDFLNGVFNEAILKYKIPKDKFILGGFSLGGIVTLRYAELAFTDNTKTAIIPKVVYSVDGPVDFGNMYRQFEREIEKNISPVAVNEAKYYLEGMKKYFGGSPAEHPEKYILYSIYSRSEKNGGNAKYLKSIPLRIYSDPDIEWAMKNRQRDLYDMNAPDQTAMIIELNLLGNRNAEYINSLGKGYRLDGMRHPHSWSLVDPNDCMNWIKRNLQ